MKRTSTAEEKANRDKALKAKTKSRSPSTGGGMKKDVQVKSYTRRTKSGKVVTVKAHTAKREAAKRDAAAKQPIGSGVKSSAEEKEQKRRQLKSEKLFDESNELDVRYLETLTEGTLEYKKGKTSFDTLVNAISSLCTTEKGKYGFSDESPIYDTLIKSRGQFTTHFYKAVCSGVRKKLRGSMRSVPEYVRDELRRSASTHTDLDKDYELKRLLHKDNLDKQSRINSGLKKDIRNLKRRKYSRRTSRLSFLKINGSDDDE